ncbi:hydantoinase B/oxoprolinase family protein [Marinivivus vitaminiproducens]|uniref:hydantoinase B/oxoprolinase family protein n=1 Tax=Marinivivus vitaminiproducens TaxID=3035935 RepID=UPI0027A32F7A|nr:hydantoinase B/oxoprolinase family protein [Geminicoccaceae bacterium SCSIO 64248]
MSQASDTTLSPIAFELFKNAIFSIADEMALTIFRTTYSGVLKDNMDYSTAFCDANGKLVAQGLTLPGHLGSIPSALDAVVKKFGDDIGPGDIFAMNDPFEGGMHLPDIFVFKPLFHEGRRVAFAATICHHTDVGGRVAGSNASDSTEIYQEGLRIPPLKLFEAGKRNETLFALIEKNVRVPVKVFGDLRAQLAACHIAERQFAELITEYGAATVDRLMVELIDYAERLTRAALSDLPDGTWSFEDFIDDDGIDVGKPIRLMCTITKEGDGMTVDWTGSSPQVKGAINNTFSFSAAAAYTAVRSVLPAGIPNNEGVFRAIKVICEPGTVTWGVLPAACAARGLTGFRMTDCCFGALAMMLPDQVNAAGDGGNTGLSIGGYDVDRKPFIYVDFTCGAWGGRPWGDGLDGNSHMMANMASQSVEVTEQENPIQILAYEFSTDRAGPGKFRGGVPFYRDYRFLEDEGVLQVRSDRRDFPPFGLYGGYPGKGSMNWLNPGEGGEPLPSKLTLNITKGTIFRHEVAGAGGWGDPLEREPARVLDDARNEKISVRAAADNYGVVIDAATWTVDQAATNALRERVRTARGWTEMPVMLRERPTHAGEGDAR